MDYTVPRVAQDLSLRAEELILLGDKVLIECDQRQDGRIGLIWLPPTRTEAYPTSGWVIAIGPDVDGVDPGDFVLIEEEGGHVDSSLYDLFEVVLRHEDGFIESIYAEIETEPVIREQVIEFRKGGPDSTIKVMDKKAGGSISFNCSNVVDLLIGEMSNAALTLSYVPVFMIWMTNGDDMPALYYITTPSRILATIGYSSEDHPLPDHPLL